MNSVNSLSKRQSNVDLVIIGGSAGALDVLLKLFAALPETLNFALIIIMHLPGDRESRLVEVLQLHTVHPVAEAEDKASVLSEHIYVAGSGYHLSVESDYTFSLSCEPPLHFSRPSIDILMGSAASAYGEKLMGILLTGANVDRAEGMKMSKEAGGKTIVQNPQEAQVRIMPEEAIKQMQPDLILTTAQICNLITEINHKI